MKYKIIIDKNSEEEIIAVVHSPSALTEQIENLVRCYAGDDGVIGYKDEEIKKLSFGEIECITVIDRKVIAIDKERDRYLLKERLRNLEDILPTYFIRINKSTIANERRIRSFEATFSGGVDAVFCCGYREYVSRRCFSEIRRRLK